MTTMRRWLLAAVLAIAVFLLAGRTVTALAVDHAWYESLGFSQLFWEEFVDRIAMQGGAWLVGSAFAFLNLYAVRRTIAAVAMQSRIANLEFTSVVPPQRLLSATVVLSLLTGAVLAIPMTDWTSLALVRYGLPFGEIEGVLGRDLGFYVYWLPFEETWYLWSLVSVVSLTAMVIVLYALTRSLRLDGSKVAASTHVRRHLSVLGALILLILAWSYRLDAFDLLQYGSGPDGVFLKVDHRIIQRMDWLLSALCGIAAAVVLRAGWIGQLRAALVTVMLILGAAISLRHVAPALIIRTDLLGEASLRDQDYFDMRSAFSRRAFGVDRIETIAPDSLFQTAGSLASTASLWDERSLREALGTRLGTDGMLADDNNQPRIDREGIVVPDRKLSSDGSQHPVSVGWFYDNRSIRALVVAQPTVEGKFWRASIIDVTKPSVTVHDAESMETEGGATTTFSPLVAPGLSSVRLVDREQFPDIPGAAIYTSWSRLAHAWALRDTRLIGGGRDSSMVVVSHRDVRGRVDKLAPIFVQGREVYPIRELNRLYWALNLYTASDRYPLSLRWLIGGEAYSYFNLAATALVDAATGRVTLIPAAHPDAITRTWMSLVPNLFIPAERLLPSLVSQLPPATDGATAQIRTFVRYGSRRSGPLMRYLPDSVISVAGAAPFVAPAREQNSTEYVVGYSIPVLDQDDNLDGVLTVSGGRGRSTSFTSIAQDRKVSWSRITTELSGTLAPDHNNIDKSDSTGLIGTEQAPKPPRVSRVRVFLTNRGILGEQVRFTDGDQLAIERVAVTDAARSASGITLSEALAAMGESVTDGTAALGQSDRLTVGRSRGGDGGTDASTRASRLYNSMRRALRTADWKAFGAAFDSLGVILGKNPP